jgi:hypothetical protein
MAAREVMHVVTIPPTARLSAGKRGEWYPDILSRWLATINTPSLIGRAAGSSSTID